MSEKDDAAKRLNTRVLMGYVLGAAWYPECRAYAAGMQAHLEGLSYTQNPYDDPALRWHWIEGYSTHSNMRYYTLHGAVERIAKPPRGHIV